MYEFGPLMSSDNGIILVCSFNQLHSANSTISVIFAPNITRAPGSAWDDPLIVKEGMSTMVTLTVTSNPRPSYIWLRNGEQVTSSNGVTLTLDSITLDPAMREHSGMYRLVATNSAGMGDFNFTLDVQYPPEFAPIRSDAFNCTPIGVNISCASYLGVNGILFCGANGNPTPVVTRSLSGVATTSNIDASTGNDIHISSVVIGNAGTYVCVAASSVFNTSVSRTFQLFVGGIPTFVVALNSTFDDESATVTFSWSYDNSANGVPATNFVLVITQNQRQVIEFNVPVSSDDITVPLSQLSRGEVYNASIQARNLQGESEPMFHSFIIPVQPTSSAVESYG